MNDIMKPEYVSEQEKIRQLENRIFKYSTNNPCQDKIRNIQKQFQKMHEQQSQTKTRQSISGSRNQFRTSEENPLSTSPNRNQAKTSK